MRQVDAPRTYQLRSRVLRDGEPHDGFDVDALPGTFHLGAFVVADDGEELAGVATFVPHADGWWQLRGMAVDPGHRGKGLGRRLLDEAEVRLRSGGGPGLWANARDSAIGFYERAGWRVLGEGFVLVGLPHHRMERSFTA